MMRTLAVVGVAWFGVEAATSLPAQADVLSPWSAVSHSRSATGLAARTATGNRTRTSSR